MVVKLSFPLTGLGAEEGRFQLTGRDISKNKKGLQGHL